MQTQYTHPTRLLNMSAKDKPRQKGLFKGLVTSSQKPVLTGELKKLALLFMLLLTFAISRGADYITLSPGSLSFTGAGGSQTVTISTNVSLSSLSVSYNGCVSNATRSGNVITVTCGVNTGNPTGGSVSVTCPTAGTGISVSQGSCTAATASAGSAMAAICSGGTSAPLGGSVGGSATGGTWSSSAGGTFSPYAYALNATWTPPAGYYGGATLTLTTTGGCTTATASKSITVNPSPGISLSSGSSSQSVCVNSSISQIRYTVSYASGASVTGLPSGVTGSYSSGTFTISGTPTSSGTFNYTVTTTGSSCTNPSASGSITVNPAATANAGAAMSSICQGGTSAPLGGSVGGSATGGTWSTPAGGSFSPSATTLNATWTPPAGYSGTATLTLTSGGGCGTATASKSIIVSTLPAITGASPGFICGSGSTTLTVSSTGGTINWYAASTGGSSLGTGTSFTTPVLSSTTTYWVDVTNGSCTSSRSSIQAIVNVVPTITGITPASRCGSGAVTLSATASDGAVNWYAAPTGGVSLGTGPSFTTPSISSTTTYWVDATTICTTPTRTAVIATINNPLITGVTPASRCGSGPVTLSATASAGATINWYPASSGGSSLGTGSSFTTPTLSGSTTYYAEASIAGCTSARTAVTATVNDPLVTGVTPAARCGSGPVTLSATASAGATVNWYPASSGGSSLGTGTSFTTPSLSSTTTYWVDATNGSCTTATRTAVTATINTIPSITGTTPAARCGTGSVTLSASASAGTINWYAASSGGSSLGTGTSFTTPSISTTTTYWVDATNGSCTTATRTAVTATINEIPAITGVTPAARCGTGSVTLSASASLGTINWYAASSGGSSLGTGTSFTTPSISSTTTYWVDATNGSCTTATRTAVTATINTIPVISNPAPASMCGPGTVIISVTASAGTVSWYDAPTGGTLLATGNSFTIPNLTVTTTFYAEATTGTCTTPTRTAVTATINAIPAITGTTPASRCGTGSVTLSASASAGTINWYAASSGGILLGTGNSFTTPSLSSTTTYWVEATTGSCTTPTRTAVTATINAIPSITGVTPAARCGAGTVTLSASASAGTINWYAASSGGSSLGTGSSFTTPSISTTTTYWVDATNGSCTTATRTAVTATINEIPAITGVTPAARCGAGSVTLSASASLGTINWYAASSGGSSLGTGTSFTTPSISTTTTYWVDATNGSCTTATRTAVIATINVVPAITGASPGFICGSGSTTLTVSSTGGTVNWYSASTGGTSLGTGTSFTTPVLSATTTYYMDVTNGSCTSARSSVQAIVNVVPTITNATPASRCGAGTVTLGATASDGAINWYATPTGGTSLGTGPTFTTPSISSTTTYWVDATTICTTPTRTAVVATINNPLITGVTPASRCGSGAVTLAATASAGATINWYPVSSGGSSLGTGSSFTTPSLSVTTTYYAEASIAGCSSARTAVTATINAIPDITGVTPAARCGSGTVTLAATASAGATINWYATPTGGTPIGTGPGITTPTLSVTTTYYAEATNGTCTSATRTAVTATINTIPDITGVTPAARCGSGTVTLAATASAGATVNWYSASSGGTSLGTGNSYTTPSISFSTTYYAEATNGSCTSAARSAVTATINPLPAITGASPGFICGSGTTTLTVSTTGGTVNWYSASSGGTSLGTGTSFTTPVLSATTTYYMDVTNGSCTSARSSVQAIVNVVPTITNATPASRCGAGTVTLGATASDGAINWYATPTGGVSLGTGPSFTTPSISSTTTYYVDATTICTTSTRTAVTATVNAPPVITGTTPAARCGTGTVTLSATASYGNIYWYSAPTGGSSLGMGSSFTTPSISSTTTYWVESTSGSCITAARTAVTATINEIPAINNVTPGFNCGPGSMTLSVSSTGGTVNWYSASSGGTLLGTGNSFTTPVISATTTYYAEATTGSCTSTRTAVPATIFDLPTITGVTPASRCGSGSVTLSATASEGAGVIWYADPTGGTSLGAGPSFTTPSLSATTTYWVEASTNCTSSSRTAVTATINTVPAITGTTPGSSCYTGTVTLAATASAGTIHWYSVPTGGMYIGTGTSFTTPSISTTTTYWVETTNGTCTSARTAVVASIDGPVITGTTPAARCGAGTVTIGATASAGTISWFAASTGGTSLGTGSSFTTPSISTTTTYWAEASTGTCTTPTRTAVAATVNTIPSITGVTPGTVCGSGSATLTVSSTAGTINWYAASTGGSSLGTGTTFTTPVVSVTTNYYAEATTGSCTSARVSVPAIVYPLPAITGVTPASRCGAGVVTLNATASEGGVFWYSDPTGGTSLGSGPSFTTPSLSSTTTYWVEASTNCSSARTAVTATINNIPTTATVGQDQTLSGTLVSGALGGNTPGVGTGVWSIATGGTGSFSNPGSGNSTFTASDYGTYVLRWTISNASCTSSAHLTVNFNDPASQVTPPRAIDNINGVLTVVDGLLPSDGTWEWYDNYTGGAVYSSAQDSYTPAAVSGSVRYRARGKWTAPVDGSTHSYFVSQKVQKTGETITLPADKNYVVTYSPVVETTSEADLNDQYLEDQGALVQYFDGLGRPTQAVAVNQSWFFNDMVSGVGYDSFGRQDKTFLPVTRHGLGAFFDDYTTSIAGFYPTTQNEVDGLPVLMKDIENKERIATLTQYEPSPLNRVTSVTDPAGGVTSYTYGTNDTGEVINFSVVGDDCVNNGTYARNLLFMTQTTDPSGKMVKEYKDKLGKVLLKVAGDAKTYYVYDDKDLLRYVLSPEASVKMNSSGSYAQDNEVVRGLCYYYEYDDHKRMVEKQLPGTDPVYMVYDARDRLVMTQDGKTRAENPNKWMYTKYEELNRPVETGFMTTTFDFESLKDNFKNTIEFADFNFPEVLTQTQYDTYPNVGLCTLTGRNDAVQGQVTFQKAKILDQNGQYRESYFFYDSKYRLIQTIVTGGDLINQSTVNTYDFAGRVIESIETYSGQTSQSVHRWFTYDHAGRLEKTEQQIGSDARVVLAQNDYNELGQMMLKKLHSKGTESFVQDMDYSYNVQGWLTGINSLEDASFRKLYAQMLGYNPNGNIQSIAWKNNRPNGTNPVEQGNRQKYLFTYDGLNRLDKAEYSEFDQLRQLITAREGFFNEDPGYDLNGNIVTLLRKGSTDALGTQGDIIDNLAYTYKTNSNQLQKVTDGVAGSLAHNKHFINASTSDYAYDQNGNATFVPNKRDTIRYNYLNLPEKMTIVGQGTISYLYDASGNKLKKSYDPLTCPTVDSYYQGSVLLTGGKVMVMNGEGRSVKNSTSWDYEYDLKDHLGNTRISFLADNGQVSVLQVKDYYPFGMEMTNGQSIAGDPTKYLYNGKELQDEAGLDFYDYGARFYDPVVGRWHSVDLLADKYYALSPYVYVADNPLKFIDPDGKKIIIAGSPEFQGATFKAMQKLSSSNLVMLKSGQIVEASNYKGAKSNIAFTGTGTGKKDFGTSLIHDLSSNQKHTVTVTPGSEANNTNDFTPTVRNYSNAHNPEKGDGGTIRFDPESTGSGIVNKDGSTGVDGSIILGHELIHADKAMNGKTLNRENNISDPASPSNWPQDISKEEVDTRKKENILRQESNIKKERLTP